MEAVFTNDAHLHACVVLVVCQIGADLIAETEEALTNLLRELGVADADGKHCCVLKLLRTQPGASRQLLHYDISQQLPLRIRRYVNERRYNDCASA